MAKIFIDAGHGGSDSGAVKGTRYEKNDNLNMSLKLQSILESWGHTVYMSRTTDKYVDLNARPKQANNVNADYFLSVHRNSVTDTTAKGIEIWIHSNSVFANTDTRYKTAKAIVDSVANVTGYVNRGVKKGYPGQPNSNFAVNNYTNMNSALIEIGFISNDNDNSIFDNKFSEIAETIAKSLCESRGYEVAPTPEPTPTPTPGPTTLYKVQVGAYEVKENAEQMQKTLAAAGFPDTIIVTTTTGAEEPAPTPAPTPTPTPTPSVSINKNDLVKVKSGAKDYNGNDLAAFVYETVYTVLEEPKNNRVVIGLAGNVTAAMKAEDLIKV